MRLSTVVFAILSATLSGAMQVSLQDQQARLKNDPSFPQADSALFNHAESNSPINTGGNTISLADTLTIDRRGGLWWDYARDVTTVTARLSHNAPGTKTTILVPVDSAIMALPKKPHQNPDGEKDTEESMQKNVERFISAHIIPQSVELPSGSVQTLLEGLEIEIVQKDGSDVKWVIQPGDIEVLDIKQASNGQILYLGGVINP